MDFFNILPVPNKNNNTIINDIKTFLNGLNPTDLQNRNILMNEEIKELK